MAGTLLAAAGLLVYLFGLVGSMVVASSGSFINEQGFQGNEEIAALMVLAVSPGGVMIALGTAVAARGRAHRWRVAGWAAAALLLLAAPLGWVGHWDDGGQGGLIPAPIAPAIVCLLVAAVAVSRRPAPGAG
ncbi:hypothetical protein OHA72_58130 [Dactylosporangium sp. NBC_01737]|uniref:hypothetical protein n=1 Tax=Dactylosporangium sp. NBC_01737 TaxID=2975959 RepID=UPI002E143CE7|nr:hypothetical protein OHA72_58130 [Dactylosporangium sp. NBC_01737]